MAAGGGEKKARKKRRMTKEEVAEERATIAEERKEAMALENLLFGDKGGRGGAVGGRGERARGGSFSLGEMVRREVGAAAAMEGVNEGEGERARERAGRKRARKAVERQGEGEEGEGEEEGEGQEVEEGDGAVEGQGGERGEGEGEGVGEGEGEGEGDGVLEVEGGMEGEGEGEGGRNQIRVKRRAEREQGEAAWEDEEDAEEVVNIAIVNRLRKLRKSVGETEISGSDYVQRLRAQHVKMHKGTEWAESLLKSKLLRKMKKKSSGTELERNYAENYGDDIDEDNEEGEGFEDEEEEYNGVLLRSDRLLGHVPNGRLPQGVVRTSRMTDANEEEYCKGVVQSVQFHSNAQLLLTASFDQTLRLFHIDGKINPKVQGIYLQNMPISKAAFSTDGERIIAAGRRKWFYIYDLVSGNIEQVNGVIGRDEKSLESFELNPNSNMIAFLGNNGHIILVSQNTKQWIGNLKMNGSVRTVSFSPDGNELVSGGGDGEIYHWDLRMRRCFHRGRDEGSTGVTRLVVSSDGLSMATSSAAGVVNFYDKKAYLGGNKTPQKSFMNLTTLVDTLKFNHDSQMLLFASKMKKDSMRLVHCSSKTVFSNWPTQRTPLGFVHAVDFSPGGGYLAAGNAKGKVLLYRLHHYDTA